MPLSLPFITESTLIPPRWTEAQALVIAPPWSLSALPRVLWAICICWTQVDWNTSLQLATGIMDRDVSFRDTSVTLWVLSGSTVRIPTLRSTGMYKLSLAICILPSRLCGSCGIARRWYWRSGIGWRGVGGRDVAPTRAGGVALRVRRSRWRGSSSRGRRGIGAVGLNDDRVVAVGHRYKVEAQVLGWISERSEKRNGN